MNAPNKQDPAPFFIAIRTEAQWVVAYLASADNSKEKIEFARVGRALLERSSPALFDAWQEFCIKAVQEWAKGAIGVDVRSWEIVPARREGPLNG